MGRQSEPRSILGPPRRLVPRLRLARDQVFTTWDFWRMAAQRPQIAVTTENEPVAMWLAKCQQDSALPITCFANRRAKAITATFARWRSVQRPGGDDQAVVVGVEVVARPDVDSGQA